MTHFSPRIASVLSILGSFFLPAVVFAQAPQGNGQSIDKLGQFLFQFIYFIDNYLVPLIFAVAFIVFIFGIFEYFIAGGANEEKREKGKAFMLWGFIGFFLMVSVWGIINLFTGSLGLNSDSAPTLPTFGGSTSKSAPASGAAFPVAPAAATPKAGGGVVAPPTGNGGGVVPTVDPAPAAPVSKCANVKCNQGGVCSEFNGKCEYTI
jgi:hypothetical protein